MAAAVDRVAQWLFRMRRQQRIRLPRDLELVDDMFRAAEEEDEEELRAF
jgi:hypothetical protein